MAATLPLAAMTVMLWILWRDSMRSRRYPRWVYFMRALLFIGVTLVMATNLVRNPGMFPGGSRSFAIVAIVVGILGTGYFGMKARAR